MINMLGGLFAFYWAAFFATRNVYVLGPGGINAIAWRGEVAQLLQNACTSRANGRWLGLPRPELNVRGGCFNQLGVVAALSSFPWLLLLFYLCAWHFRVIPHTPLSVHSDETREEIYCSSSCGMDTLRDISEGADAHPTAE